MAAQPIMIDFSKLGAAVERMKQADLRRAIERATPPPPSAPLVDLGIERSWQCDSCHDLHVVDRGDGKCVPCPDCGADSHRALLQRICGLSEEQQSWTFANYRPQNPAGRKALDAAKEAAVRPRGFVSFWGPWGTGKTHLLAAIVNNCRARGVVSVYRSMATLLDELRATFQNDGESFAARFDHFASAAVLALDEFDKWSITPWAEEQAFKLIDARYARLGECLTAIATNRKVSREEAVITGTRWPGYLESRLLDGRCQVLEVSGGDVRPRMRWQGDKERE